MRFLILVATLAIVAMPAASAAPVDLYLHINGYQDMPMSISPPPEWFEETMTSGLATHSACLSDPTGAQHFTDRQQHTWYAFLVNGDVLYTQSGDRLQLPFDRGLAAPLDFDDALAPQLTWFMAAQPDAPGTAESTVLANLVIEVTMRAGDDVSVRNEAFNKGEILAHGRLGPMTITPASTPPGVSAHDNEGQTIYGFDIPLALQALNVSQEESFNLRIDAYVDNPACRQGYAMPDVLRPHTSAEARPMLTLGAADPLRLAAVHPAFINDDFILHVQADNPFGVADTRIELQSDLPFSLVGEPDRNYHCHGCGALPAVWTFGLSNVTQHDGTHEIRLLVTNAQGTAASNVTMTLDVVDGQATLCMEECLSTASTDQQAPAVPVVFLLLGLIALVRRQG